MEHSPLEWLTILTEEFLECYREFMRVGWGGGSVADLKKEAIQVAAVAKAIWEQAVKELNNVGSTG